jgi:hypothetical protein
MPYSQWLGSAVDELNRMMDDSSWPRPQWSQRKYIHVASYLAISVWCSFYYCSIAPSPDQSIFDYIAWQGLHGVRWYTGSFDFTWPGSLLIHEVGIRLFGVNTWTARLTDLIFVQPAIAAMYYFFKAADLKSAAGAIILVYPIIYVTSGGWMAGHRDIVAMHMLVIASSISVTSGEYNKVKLFCSGIFIGYAVLIRPTYLTFLPLLCATFFFPLDRSTLKPALRLSTVLVLGTLAFPTIFLLAGFLTGTLDRFLVITRFALEVYPVQLSRARLFNLFADNIQTYFAWLCIAGLVGAFLWINDRVAKKQAALLLAMAITALVSFAAQNKGFGYHLGGLIPVFTMSALGAINLGFSRPGNSTQLKIIMRTLAAAVLFIVCVGTGRRIQHNFFPYFESLLASHTTAETDANQIVSQTVDVVSQESDPGSYFFQWGWNYDVGFLSKRLAASQYLNTPALSLINKDDVRYKSWLDTFDKELSEKKPTFILLDLTTLPNQTTITDRGVQFLQEEPSPALAILARHLNERYIIRQEWKDRALFKRMQTGEMKSHEAVGLLHGLAAQRAGRS